MWEAMKLHTESTKLRWVNLFTLSTGEENPLCRQSASSLNSGGRPSALNPPPIETLSKLLAHRRLHLSCATPGTKTRYNEEDERAIVNGAHTNATLQQLVHKYVELFVLCPNCRLPESSEWC